MSTQINISYEGGDLRDANRQQAAANRLANQLRLNQSRVQAQGEAILSARRAAAGANGNGQINDYPFTPPYPEEEPAAFRRSKDYLGQLFSNIYSTREGQYILDITTVNGQQYTFELASTFPYLETDGVSVNFLLEPDPAAGSTNPADLYEQAASAPPGYEYYANGGFFASLPVWGGSWSVTEVKNTAQTQDSIYDGVDFRMPLKKDRFIWAVAGRAIRARATASLTKVRSFSSYAVESGYQINWSDAYSEEKAVQYEKIQYKKCFIVDNNRVREIPLPASLSDKFDQYLGDKDISVNWTYQTFPIVVGRVDNEDVISTEPRLYGGYFTIVDTPSIGYWYPKYKLFSFLATNESVPYATRIATPGVYAALQTAADDETASYTNTSMSSVAYVVTTFYDGSYAKLPKYGLQSQQAGPDPETGEYYFKHYRTRSRPTVNGYIPPSGLKGSAKLKTDSGEGLFWDWNESAYCRQQLLALGFSAGDLTFPPL
jgi:hypothetical protein